ncbi:hypothetical protein [Paenibacillus sp. 481]|uniref:hypothetical protein n=1 Tax=Paenibacillus sp. 481 TaxID=2835869 RepID=UPI001E33F35E|nr:hypothetical protein [Paenibacillus sp. 481]UHA73617.1 hypothetical protein KIK04_00050 [Paenibacillus sp. 481]
MHACSYFLTVAKHRMVHHYLLKFQMCLESLAQEMIWHQEQEHLNDKSIGAIVIHIMEHVTRATIRLTDPEHVFKGGIENYFPHHEIGKEELLKQLQSSNAALEYGFLKSLS